MVSVFLLGYTSIVMNGKRQLDLKENTEMVESHAHITANQHGVNTYPSFSSFQGGSEHLTDVMDLFLLKILIPTNRNGSIKTTCKRICDLTY